MEVLGSSAGRWKGLSRSNERPTEELSAPLTRTPQQSYAKKKDAAIHLFIPSTFLYFCSDAPKHWAESLIQRLILSLTHNGESTVSCSLASAPLYLVPFTQHWKRRHILKQKKRITKSKSESQFPAVSSVSFFFLSHSIKQENQFFNNAILGFRRTVESEKRDESVVMLQVKKKQGEIKKMSALMGMS